MAKKRVHELAKQYDMPTSEVIKRLNAAGLQVKAAATAVDEKLADAALTGKPKPKAIASNGAAKKPAAPVLQARAGFGHGTARAPRAENLAPKTPPKPKAKPKPKPKPL
jgi:translation initiation factor IF-2